MCGVSYSIWQYDVMRFNVNCGTVNIHVSVFNIRNSYIRNLFANFDVCMCDKSFHSNRLFVTFIVLAGSGRASA